MSSTVTAFTRSRKFWRSPTGKPKNSTFRICAAIAFGVSIVNGKLPVRYAFASDSSRSLTRSRCSRQNSSTIKRNTWPVSTVRVFVSASKSPLSLNVLKSACAPYVRPRAVRNT